MQEPEVTIIGTGALGSTLARALYEHGIPVKSLYNRTESKVRVLATQMEISIMGGFPTGLDELGSLVFISVRDGDIREVTERLFSLEADFSTTCFVHCSGTETSEVLNLLKEKGASVAAFNPLQTFTGTSVPKDFKNISFGLEGDDKAKRMLKRVAEKIGASCIELSPDAKPYVHAAAVMASNYFLALMQAAEDIVGLGSGEAVAIRKALAPLVKKSLDNASADDLSIVLSGPIVRGDISTVSKHLQLLKQNDRLSGLYKQLGKETLKLAVKSGKLTDEQEREINSMLNIDG